MTSPESALLSRMNALKQIEPNEHLTSAQMRALEEIKEYREDGEPFINLHGPQKSGKTFLCWALREHGWDYLQAPPRSVTKPAETAVIYDHGEPDRASTRQLRNSVDLSGLSNVVYVTQTPAKEVYPRVKLDVDEEHFDTIATNWEKLGIDTAPIPSVDATVKNNS